MLLWDIIPLCERNWLPPVALNLFSGNDKEGNELTFNGLENTLQQRRTSE